MTARYYTCDDNGNPIPTDDILEWGRWLENTDNRRVAQDLDEADEGKTIRVSTVFLGVDHSFGFGGPPVLWETFVFGGLLDGEMDRYTSKEAALLGHQQMCERVMATLAKNRGDQEGDPK